MGDDALLVAGLGNPGDRYRGTRHNMGWHVVDVVADRAGLSWKSGRFEAVRAEGRLPGEPGGAPGPRVLLLKPLTYMNHSGRAVAAARAWLDVEPSAVLLVVDDLALDPGRIRVRRSGSSGGQKGVDSVIRSLGTDEIPRVRVGIGRPRVPGPSPADYVLARPPADERELLEEAVHRAADAVTCWAREGVEAAMNRFNAEDAAP